MKHKPTNSHVLVSNEVHQVFRAHWSGAGVAYMLFDGRMVYSWEPSVEPMEGE